MHNCPNDDEKYLYLKTNKFYFYYLGIYSTILLFTGMCLFIISHPFFYVFLPFVIVTLFYLTISYAVGIFSNDFDHMIHKIIIDFVEYKPTIDIYYTCAGEDFAIIYNSLKAIQSMVFHSPYIINVYVLDDQQTNKYIRLVCSELEFNYIARPSRGEWKKAGNLRYAFEKTKGDLIVIFDADFCPRPDFLTQTVPYFAKSDIGIIQTPQFFQPSECTNWIDRGSAIIQILFYKLIQTNRNHFGAAICVGTNAVYRRKALEPFGGTALIGYSEDVHTGFNVVNSGYKLKYIPINLAKGLCPNRMSQYFNQQYRWCMGSLTLALNKGFWVSSLNYIQKLCYMSGMLYYVITAISIFINCIPSLLVLYFLPQFVLWYSVLWSIPSLLFGTVFFAYWTKHWHILDVLRSRIFSYYAYFFAAKDKLFGDLMEWIPTGSGNQAYERFIKAKRLIFIWNTLNLSLVLFGCGYHWSIVRFNSIPLISVTLFWFAVNISIISKTSD